MTEYPISQLQDPDSPAERHAIRLQPPASAMALRQKVLDSEMTLLGQAIDQLAQGQAVIDASQAIVGARRRFVLGSGRSSAFAALCAWELSVGLSQVCQVDAGAVRALDVLADVRSTDVLIVYSLRRYLRHPIAVAREFAASGGLVVAITDSYDAPILEASDVIVTVPTTSASSADSPTSLAATTHLITTLAIASAKGARRRIEERERLSLILQQFDDERREA